LKWPNIYERATQGGYLNLYVSVYWLFSHSVHMNAGGLDQFLSEVGEAIEFRPERDPAECEQVLLSAASVYMELLDFCNKNLGSPAGTELAKWRGAFQKQASSFNEASGSEIGGG
jgi:hypothetical protein